MPVHSASGLLDGTAMRVQRVKAHDRFSYPLSLFVSMNPVQDTVHFYFEYLDFGQQSYSSPCHQAVSKIDAEVTKTAKRLWPGCFFSP